jgi:hypothetical protein
MGKMIELVFKALVEFAICTSGTCVVVLSGGAIKHHEKTKRQGCQGR